MKKLLFFLPFLVLLACHSGQPSTSGGWVSLFDGHTLNGWRVGDNAETFWVDSNAIIVHGKTAHLFYDGSVQGHNFKNFEFSADVKTMPGANSGIYFHTAYQQGGWPKQGYEVQVNNSHTDWRRTGSLYGVSDVRETYVKDGEWYTESIRVQGKHVVIQINNKTVVDYTEPDSVAQTVPTGGRRINSGTFALQGHDPNSVVYYKNIRIRPLTD